MDALTIDSLEAAFAAERYVADRDLATAVYLALTLDRPLLLEGEAGVGKTEVGRTLAAVLKTELIRLQCYEGLDVNTAVYEWDYPRQMLEIRLLEARGEAKQAATRDIFSEQFLIRRPLLKALANSRPQPPVLLIDEIDRADEEFEAYLLEVLADFAITIPEIGTIKAERPPHVIITSNRTREVHDALKRRCLYHWIDYPTADRELEILRRRDLTKVPGIAETIDWAAALTALGAQRLEPEQIERTLGALLKYQEDLSALRGGGAAKLLDEVRAATR